MCLEKLAPVPIMSLQKTSPNDNIIKISKLRPPRLSINTNEPTIIYYEPLNSIIFYIDSVFYAFNSEHNIYYELTKCPFQSSNNLNLVLNDDENKLCLFDGSGRLFASYSIDKTKIWKMHKRDKKQKIVPKSDGDSIIYIPSPIKQFVLYNENVFKNESDTFKNLFGDTWSKMKENGSKIMMKANCLKEIRDAYRLIIYLKLLLLFNVQYIKVVYEKKIKNKERPHSILSRELSTKLIKISTIPYRKKTQF